MGLRRRSGSTDTVATPKAEKVPKAEKLPKAERKAVEKALKEEGPSGRTPLTAARAKRLIGVGTTVAPLLAPYAMAAAGAVRGRWDSYRAARLGVAPEQLGQFSGPGGALHARLSHVADALNELDSAAEIHSTTAAKRFAEETRPRLVDLSVAVRAAEQMPSSRRRAAYRAIAGELDVIESALLTHLGITT
jgi:hypothetical protein